MLPFSNLPIHAYTPITERKTHTQKQVLQSSRSWTNFTNSNRILSGYWQQFSHGSNKIYLFLTTKTNGNITLGITSAWLRVQSVDSPMLHVVVRPKTHHPWTPLSRWLYPLYCFDPALNTSYPGRLDSTHSTVLTQPKIHHPLDTLDSTHCIVSTQHRKHHTMDTLDSTRCTVSTQPKYIIPWTPLTLPAVLFQPNPNTSLDTDDSPRCTVVLQHQVPDSQCLFRHHAYLLLGHPGVGLLGVSDKQLKVHALLVQDTALFPQL